MERPPRASVRWMRWRRLWRRRPRALRRLRRPFRWDRLGSAPRGGEGRRRDGAGGGKGRAAVLALGGLGAVLREIENGLQTPAREA